MYRLKNRIVVTIICAVLSACATKKTAPQKPPAPEKDQTTIPAKPPAPKSNNGKPSSPIESEIKPEIKLDLSLLKPIDWSALEGWTEDNLTEAWPAWLHSCSTLKNKAEWQEVCGAADALRTPDNSQLQAYFKTHFTPYLASNADNSDTGLITGYYQPLVRGSTSKSVRYAHPIYEKPSDMLTIDISSVYPELAGKRVRGRLVENKVVPYYSRAEIEGDSSPLKGKELYWVDDPIDVFFLQVQGSGIVQLESGERIPVGYADQNGQSYQSIGRLLVERGELPLEKASMQGIKDWAKRNPNKLAELLNSNPSYVFFRRLPTGLTGPLGALGVPITAERSVAIDPKYVPLGAPIFLSTTYPNAPNPLKRMMLAQDTGGAIKGPVRADFFWGAGDEAGKQAGAMKQKGKIWILLPKGYPIVK